jgi:hypothetical protein
MNSASAAASSASVWETLWWISQPNQKNSTSEREKAAARRALATVRNSARVNRMPVVAIRL